MQQEIKCALCGSATDLVPDPVLEDIWYCNTCLDRDRQHQAVIDHGMDDEDPKIE